MEQHVTCHETVSEQNSDTQAPGGGNQDARPEAGGRRKVRWRSSSPLRGSPPLTWPRMAMPFDRPPTSWLFAPRISDTNKWCKSTSRKRQEAELRTRIAKHLSGRVRPHDAFKHTDHRQPITDNRSPTTTTEPRQQPLFTSTIAYKCSYIRSYIIRNESLESRLHAETPVIW